MLPPCYALPPCGRGALIHQLSKAGCPAPAPASTSFPPPPGYHHLPPPHIFQLQSQITTQSYFRSLKQPDAVKNTKGATAALRPRIRHVRHLQIHFRSPHLPAQKAAPCRQPPRAGPAPASAASEGPLSPARTGHSPPTHLITAGRPCSAPANSSASSSPIRRPSAAGLFPARRLHTCAIAATAADTTHRHPSHAEHRGSPQSRTHLPQPVPHHCARPPAHPKAHRPRSAEPFPAACSASHTASTITASAAPALRHPGTANHRGRRPQSRRRPQGSRSPGRGRVRRPPAARDPPHPA